MQLSTFQEAVNFTVARTLFYNYKVVLAISTHTVKVEKVNLILSFVLNTFLVFMYLFFFSTFKLQRKSIV